jgi:hypothetical protein
MSQSIVSPVRGSLKEAKSRFCFVSSLACGLRRTTQFRQIQALPVPQEISVSYRAIKSRVYRLIDALVVGEKTGAEVQESIRRWWNLIPCADRPIAQKYLLIVLGRSLCLHWTPSETVSRLPPVAKTHAGRRFLNG